MMLWDTIQFQKIFFLSFARLGIYISKVYHDIFALHEYYNDRAVYFAIITLISLVSPSIIYAIYISSEAWIKRKSNGPIEVITQFINGLLLIPWQLKRHLDGLYFGSQHLLVCRPTTEHENEQISEINRTAEVLEFFEDMYAGFLQILLQLYLFTIEIDEKNTKLFLIGELGSSILSILSMLIAIRRRDDGKLTGFFSFFGWTAMFISRTICFAMGTKLFRMYFFAFTIIHILGFTIWVYKIAVRSHEVADTIDDVPCVRQPLHQNKFQLAMLVFFFFGLPSLVVWPIMFQLKEKKRPLVFLMVVTIENMLLLLLWIIFKNENTETERLLILIVIGSTITAVLFISAYLCLKPKLTDMVALHDMRATEKEMFGIYYEFCDIVFKLKISRDFQQTLNDVRYSSPPEPGFHESVRGNVL